MFSRSIAARLMAPLAMSMALLCVLAAVVFWSQSRVAAANSSAIEALDDANGLLELRSISRALQRDALNLITEDDQAARTVIVGKFDSRLSTMRTTLAAMQDAPDHSYVPDTYFTTQANVIDALAAVRQRASAGDRTGALALFREQVRPAERAGSEIADGRIEALNAEVKALRTSAREANELGQWLLLGTTVVLSAAGLVAGFTITRRGVVEPLLDLGSAMKTLAQGNTTLTIPHTSREDEMGQMAEAMAEFRNQLAEADRAKEEQAVLIVSSVGEALEAVARGDLSTRVTADLTGRFARLKTDFNFALGEISQTMQSVNRASSSIHNGVAEIRQASDDLARRTEQQAASLEETSAAIGQLTQGLRDTAAGAGNVHTAIGRAEQQAGEGQSVVSEAVDAMDGIERSAQEIAQIVGVIDGIAFQTNLLALNAGVEAARAGESGRGFAVVASEVRALAQRSADAARDIKALIEASSRQVTRGVELVGRSGDVFERIATQVADISTQVARIADVSRTQSANLAQIDTTVRSMDLTTQQNAAMVEESNAAAHSLGTEATRLNELVGQFRMELADQRASAGAGATPIRRFA